MKLQNRYQNLIFLNFELVFLSDTVGNNLELSIEAEVGSGPITTAFKHKDVVGLDAGDDIVIALEPVVAASVHPSDVMTAVGRATLVGHDTNELIAAGVEA